MYDKVKNLSKLITAQRRELHIHKMSPLGVEPSASLCVPWYTEMRVKDSIWVVLCLSVPVSTQRLSQLGVVFSVPCQAPLYVGDLEKESRLHRSTLARCAFGLEKLLLISEQVTGVNWALKILQR